MKSDTIETIKSIALDEYYQFGRGIKYIIQQDKFFANNNKGRMTRYREGGGFNMYASERYYHLAGFIDALNWAYRKGYLPENINDFEDDYWMKAPFTDERRKAMQKLMCYLITGESDW